MARHSRLWFCVEIPSLSTTTSVFRIAVEAEAVDGGFGMLACGHPLVCFVSIAMSFEGSIVRDTSRPQYCLIKPTATATKQR